MAIELDGLVGWGMVVVGLVGSMGVGWPGLVSSVALVTCWFLRNRN